jgi:hypothetical protein
MKKIFFVLAFAPVFLLASVFTLSVPSALAWCVDNDGDDYGVAHLQYCPHPEPDCDDANPNVNPGVIEEGYGDLMCEDGADNDCDGLIDGLDPGCFECTTAAECNDGNVCTDDACVAHACAHTDNTAPCDDQDDCTLGDACSMGVCVGGPPTDADGDTFVSELCGGSDCNDLNPYVNPGVLEGPPESNACMDEVDNDCDGYTDLEDAGCMPSGWSPAEPADAAVYGSPSREGSSFSNLFLAFLMPIGAVILLRRIFRKK